MKKTTQTAKCDVAEHLRTTLTLAVPPLWRETKGRPQRPHPPRRSRTREITCDAGARGSSTGQAVKLIRAAPCSSPPSVAGAAHAEDRNVAVTRARQPRVDRR